MRILYPMLIGLLLFSCTEPESSQSIIDKAIKYHDPNSQWQKFEGTLNIKLEMPTRPGRESLIRINNERSVFEMTEYVEGDTLIRYLEPDSCFLSFNGAIDFDEEIREQKRLTCERAKMYRDYYSYLYGLPMKLMDEGTQIAPEFEQVEFKGNDYLKVKVTYDKEVGEDTWYFYFNTETYAMEVYQFFHDESKNDGEYILLEEIEEFEGMKIPKIRKWYYNEEDKYLGTDFLEEISN